MDNKFNVEVTKTKSKRGFVNYFQCSWDDLNGNGRQKVTYSLSDADIEAIEKSGSMTLQKAVASGFNGAIISKYFSMPPVSDAEVKLENELEELKREVDNAVSESNVFE